ncbi:hypothetical protein D2T29_13655 [Sinirhodobacter populi]|uniref:TIGR03016 family PEP-CTERM system-associated outer membrane protein n=1 Tax=Paenirhodobacter populi TaxID=2306993 RepID=A0A443KAN5_9RHOB|nr:hypothetical protein [Sinirhodobacter populi]RWR29828.1 hypothetical protein D2T29_13655 [Sinirhodobacter populi]
MSPPRPGHVGGALCGLLAVSVCTPLWAQEASEGGTRSTITTSIGVEAGRNLDLDPGMKDSSARLYGTLGYAYEMRTRQTLLSFDAEIQPQTDDDSSDGLYPNASLKWVHEASRTRFNFSADYTEAKVTDQSIGFDPDTGQIIDYDESGTRIRRHVSAGVEGGLDMPLGYSLQFNRSELDYRDTPANSSNAPNTSTGVQAMLRANVSSMTQLNLELAHQLYKSEGSSLRQRTTDMATLGVQQRFDALTMFSLSLGSSRIETERRNRPDETSDGLVVKFGLQREDPLGLYRLDINQLQTENGGRRYFTLGRDRETAVGTFSGTLGVTKADEGSTDWIGTLSYETELPRDSLKVSMVRSLSTDDDGDDVVVTRITGGVAHKLSDVNRLNFGLTASSTEYPDRDKQRLDATVSYAHTLTQTVSLEAGVKLGLAKSSYEEDADSQSLFLTLSRKFDFLQ